MRSAYDCSCLTCSRWWPQCSQFRVLGRNSDDSDLDPQVKAHSSSKLFMWNFTPPHFLRYLSVGIVRLKTGVGLNGMNVTMPKRKRKQKKTHFSLLLAPCLDIPLLYAKSCLCFSTSSLFCHEGCLYIN